VSLSGVARGGFFTSTSTRRPNAAGLVVAVPIVAASISAGAHSLPRTVTDGAN
jgi:hypothetical protein